MRTLSHVMSLAVAVLLGGAAVGASETAEAEARGFLEKNRPFMLAVANGQALTRAVVEARGCDGGEVCGASDDALSFLNGKAVVLKGSLVEVKDRLLSLGKSRKAMVTIGRCRQQPVNVKCHLADSAVKDLEGVGPGRPVVVKGRVGGLLGGFSALTDGCVLTLEETVAVDAALYAQAEAALPLVEEDMLGDCLVTPRPFAELDGVMRRELVEMARCAEAAYPDGDIPSWYRPLTREEWRTAVADAGYSDDIYSEDGFVVVGNGLRGRLMAHRLTGRTVVAWSGCDLDSGSDRAALDDFKTCALHLLGGDVNVQFSQALEICQGILKTREGEVWVVGHSLGGSIATYVSLATGDCGDRLKCASLNGLGVSGVLVEKLGAEACRLAGRRTVNLYCDKDPVFNGHRVLSWIGVAPRHFGRSYYVEYGPNAELSGSQTDSTLASLKASHGISELRQLADAQTPSAASEPAVLCVEILGGLLLLAIVVGVVLRLNRRFAVVALCLLPLLFAGCGDKECYVMSRDAKGLAPKAPIVWQDAYVGSVSSVEAESGWTRVSLGLKKPFDEQVRAGVSARIVNDASISPKPFVLLIGGKDMAMPVLADGAQIPEAKATDELKDQAAGFMGWLKGSSHVGETAGGGLLLVLLLVLKFVKKMVKLLIKLLILAVVVVTILVMRGDWKSYQARAEAALSGARELKSWTVENAGKVRAALEQANAVARDLK